MGRKANTAIAIDHSLLMVKAGLTPDPWQADILRSRYPAVILNCHRQAGKSAVMAAAAVIESQYYAPSVTLVLCPSERQSKELFHTAIGMWETLDARILPDTLNTTSVEFASGSRIVALPSTEKNIRGFSRIALLIIDEAARVGDDLYHSVKPMLAVSNGRIALLSTPFGKRGFYHKEWTEGVGWHRVKVTADQCPRITTDFLAGEKRSLPDAWYRQEYMCEFAETDDAVFSHDDVKRAITSDVQPLWMPSELPPAPTCATLDLG